MLKLITLLGAGIPAIVASIISFITRKVSTAAGSLAAFALLTVAFIACINLIFSQVVAVLTMPIWVANSVGMFFPSIFSVCVSSIWSAKTCRSMYDIARFKIGLVNNAS